MRHKHQLLLLSLVIFLLALVPRVTLKTHTTHDEAAHWVRRSANFLDAMQTGDVKATAQAFHPGVMTTWLGAAGILLDNAINGENHAETNNIQYRYNIRFFYSLTTAICVAIGFLFLIRLFKVSVAFLAALLWAFNIFLIEHSGILHVDGLSSSFMFLAFLSGLIGLQFDDEPHRYRFEDQVRWRWWLASAAFGGLAVLTKYTTGSVFGILGLQMLFVNYRHLRLRRLAAQVWPFVVWLIVAFSVFFVLFPAMWGFHFDAIFNRIDSGVNNVFVGHYNYFLGENTFDPGPLFYPITFVFRLTPWALIGLLILPFALWDSRMRIQRAKITAFFLFIIITVALMLIQPKKMDRYILPVYFAADVLAAIGLLGGINALINRTIGQSQRRNISIGGVWVAGIIIMASFWWMYHEYPRAYYNPLLGGGSTAVETFTVGGGEGLEQAAEWLIDNEANLCDQTIISDDSSTLGVYFPDCVNVIPMADWPMAMRDADYAIFYIAHRQRYEFYHSDIIRDAFATLPSEHTVSVYGMRYADLYDLNAHPPAIDWAAIDAALEDTP